MRSWTVGLARHLWAVLLMVGVLAGLGSASAQQLTITPISWNVIGLDSNNVNVGPNRYPVGARVCNVGSAAATNVRASLFLDGGATNPYISIYGLSTLTAASIAPGSGTASTRYQESTAPSNCADFYFVVEVARNSNAYSSRVSDTATPAQRNTQLFHIEATADGLGTVSTPTNRELYVEKLISQGRNAISQFSGPTNVLVGGTYTYTLNATTAPGGYEQLEVFTNFPNNIFQITSVSTTYTSPTGGLNSTVYADACGWENDRTSPSYHNNLTCIGPANYSGAKAGDIISTRFTVKILSAGTATVQSAINDFSGSSYHYNADFGDAINAVTITASNPVNGPDLLISKTHTAMSLGSTGTYTLSVSNGGGSATSGTVTVTDTLPTGLNPTGTSGTVNGWTCTVRAATNSVQGSVSCTRSDALAAGARYPDISIPVSVTATKSGTVTNTATVSGGNDANTSNNSASDPTTITASVNLAVTKVQTTPTAGTSVAGGGTVTYTVAVSNNGSTAADGAILSDPAVSGFNATSVTCTSSSNQSTCPTSPTVAQLQDGLILPTFAKNTTLTFTVTGTAVANTAYKISNSANVSPAAGFADTNTADNVATATTNIQNPAPVAVNDSATTSVNTAVSFSVTGNDTDTSPGTVNVATVDLDPSTTGTQTTYTVTGKGTFTVSSSGVVTFTPVAGSTGTATASYTVQDNLGSLSNTATITVTVTASADLGISKTGPASAAQGDTVTYTLRVWNQGPNSVTGAAVTDPVPGNLTGVTWTCAASGSASCGSAASGSGNSVSLTTGALPVNASATAPTSGSYLTLTVTGTATTLGSFTNTATVVVPGGTTDPASGNDSSSQATAVTAPLLTCSALYGLFGGDFTTNNNGTTVRALGDTTNTVGATVTTVPADANGNTGYSATLGIAPGGGTLYVARDSDRALLKYDVASATWSTLATLTAGATSSRLVRMTVGPDGTGYAMDGAGNFYTFGAASSGSIAPQTLTRLPASAPAFGDSGDFFADASGRLFLLSSTGTSSLDFWEISPSTGLAAYLGRITSTNIGTTTYGGFAVTPNGVYGRGSTGQLIKVDLVNLTVSAVGTANTPSTDLASCTFPAYTRAITALKTATKVAGSSGTDIQVGDTVEYAITIRNGGSVTVGAMRLQDSLPAGTAYVTGSTKLNGAAVADVGGAMPYTQANQYVNSPGQASGVLLADSTPGTLDREAVVLFRVTVNAGAKSVSNQGTVTYLDGVTKTQQTDDPGTAATPDATISVVNTPPVAVNDSASAAFNTAVTFSLTANDTDADGNGTLNLASTVFVTSGQPTGAVLSNSNRTVQVPGQGTFTLDNSGGVTFTPVGGYSGTTSPVLYTVQDTAGGTSNTATIQVQVIVGVADLTLVKTAPAYSAPSTPANPTATPPAPAITRTLTYTITVTNGGTGATSGTVTVVDTLPAGLTATALGGTGWSCTLSTLTCTRADALALGSSYPAITLTVNAPSTTELETNASLRDLTNSARVSGGGETNTGNNTGTANTKMVYVKLTKRVRNFTAGTTFGNGSAGQPGQVLEYCLDFTNYGGAALSGFKVTDNVPGTTAAVTTGYDADEPSTATGFGMRLTRGAAVSYLTSAVDTGVDRGSLSTSGGSFGSGVMEVVLPTALASGETGSVCFKARIN